MKALKLVIELNLIFCRLVPIDEFLYHNAIYTHFSTATSWSYSAFRFVLSYFLEMHTF